MAIEGVIYRKNEEIREDSLRYHEDDRRKLFTAFNGDFTAQQIKFAEMKEDAFLGGHYHNYRELFYMLRGQAKFTLIEPETKDLETYLLEEGDSLLIPQRIPHKALVKANSILVGCTEEAYISAEHNDYRYDF